MKSSIIKRIENHYTQKKYCRITRGYPTDFKSFLHGYIVDFSKDFILIFETDDFIFQGYTIIPTDSILDIRHNKNDQYIEKIHKGEELDKKVKKPNFNTNLDSFKTLFKDLSTQKNSIIIECERFAHEYFCIGFIKRVNQKSVSVQYYNAQGFLDTENTINKYSEITRITFGDSYSLTFQKYLREK